MTPPWSFRPMEASARSEQSWVIGRRLLPGFRDAARVPPQL